MLHPVRNAILGFIDFFHRPFARWVDVRTFRYLACGGTNTVLDITLYFLAFNYLLHTDVVPVFGIPVSRPIAAFMVSFSVSFPLGFMLSKYIVFQESNLRGRIQLFRYMLLVLMCIVLNYVFLKLFVEVCHFTTAKGDATPSKVLTTVVVAVFSYFSQRNFTFKVKEAAGSRNKPDL